jgi:hypothetical protein
VSARLAFPVSRRVSQVTRGGLPFHKFAPGWFDELLEDLDQFQTNSLMMVDPALWQNRDRRLTKIYKALYVRKDRGRAGVLIQSFVDHVKRYPPVGPANLCAYEA